MRANLEAGMTLIEILIAVSLLSLLSVAAFVAMRMGLNTMEKTDAHLVRDRRVENSRRIIENEIAGFEASFANFRPGPQQLMAVPFAEWTPGEMRFVTTYSLNDAWRGRPQISVIQVIPGADNRGVRLIVNETPYTGPDQAGAMVAGIAQNIPMFAPLPAGANSFVLADRLARCRFEYLEPPRRVDAPPIWRPDWELTGVTPLGVRIDMAPLELRPAEASIASITVAMKVNRDPNEMYDDQPY